MGLACLLTAWPLGLLLAVSAWSMLPLGLPLSALLGAALATAIEAAARHDEDLGDSAEKAVLLGMAAAGAIALFTGG